MASPQTENGYTRIANEILDALSRLPSLGGEGSQLLWFVLRRTYGFQKTTAEMSIRFIAQGTGLKRPSVCRAIKRLLAKRLITRSKDRITFNKNYDEWVVAKRLMNKPFSQTANDDSSQTANKSLAKRLPKKEIVKKDDKQTLSQATKPKTSIQLVVENYFELKGIAKEQHRAIFGRHVRPAKDLLELCGGDLDVAKDKLKKICDWANSCEIDWSIETCFKRWHEIDGLSQQIEKRKKAYIEGDRAYQKDDDWFVITKTGEHRKYIGSLSNLKYE